MEIIKNPWDKQLFELVRNSQTSIKILCPFIKFDVTEKMLKEKQKGVKLHLISSFKTEYFHRGASDLTAMALILKNKGSIKNYQRLHAKNFIFDKKYAVVTSANLTLGGVKNNYEYGVLIDEKNTIKSIINDFNDFYYRKNLGTITLGKVNKIKEIIDKIPSERKSAYPKLPKELTESYIDIYTGGVKSILESLTKWKKDVFECLLEIKNDTFKLKEVYAFKEHFKKKYPTNTEIEAKIRQQLQFLRDVGLVEFVKPGIYRKLWK